MIDQIVLLDNVINLEKQEEIRHELLDETYFPWFYKSTLSANTEKIQGINPVIAPGFGHVFYNESGPMSRFYDFALPIVQSACNKINFNLNEMLFGRTFLQLPLSNLQGLTNPHVDILNVDHLVCIYYVVDSDGDTVLFDKYYDDNRAFSNMKIIQRVTPRKGSALLFNGKRYHANMLPQDHLRCIINFNVR